MSTYVKSCTLTRPRKSKWCRVISWSVVMVSHSSCSVVLVVVLSRCGQSFFEVSRFSWSVSRRGQLFFVVSRSSWSVVISRAKWGTSMMTSWKCSGKVDRQLLWWKIWHWFKQTNRLTISGRCSGSWCWCVWCRKIALKAVFGFLLCWNSRGGDGCETRKITRELRWIVTKWIFLNRSHDVTVRNKRRKINVLFHRSANIVGPWKPLWHFYCIYRIIHW